MRKTFVLLAMLILTMGYAFAKEKVVETSGKTPKWIYAVEQGYIIVSAESESLEEAKNKCMLQVKKQILSSVAESVQAESTLNTHEVGVNGTYSIMDQYASIIETKSAQIPFLSEVSISKAEGFYWEKLKNKKVYSYRYHLKYPFGQFDLVRLVDDFQSKERALDNQLADFAADDFSKYTSVEQMMVRLQELKLFKASLLEEDSRFERCKSVERVYGEYIRSIQLRLIQSNREGLVFTANFREKTLSMVAPPKFKSNCLTNIQYRSLGAECVVMFDYSTCTDEQQTYIDVSFNIGGNKVKNRFVIK